MVLASDAGGSKGNRENSAYVRTSLQKHRRRPPERGRLHHRARLHRADLLAPLPEISRRPGAGQEPTKPRWTARNTPSSSTSPIAGKSWAAPKGKDGKIDHNKAMTGDDLRDFVNQKLFPYLHGFKQKASGPNTIEYKIGEIFGEIKNKIQSGYNLREIIDHIDELRFRSQTEKHELSPSLRSQDQEHGQRRAQRRRVLHAAPAHPRHRPGREAARSASASTTARAARRASCASRSTT